MSPSKYSRYFYGDIEFPKINTEQNFKYNCQFDAFFQFYCFVVSNRSNNYMARLPDFDQCLLNANRK